ncbi:MAG: 2-oxoacid:ferredoxin oxidoreductase subunit beta [Elusimicrobia bacterium CG_4_10_14_0_2_um_filter_56_8]|nr:MAG: 2-oxoacid:ferredoxin oxidoreductase subunit beta [Elusimicrobia bacterium CG1_02_56_21]PJA15210.1 MAG: 2-oxoacid:ferredoxin oxidoreductase subunit beta [Elusimicrobia bacterium CG_4_10_14_0_2_um_filter_56_8]
MENTMEKKLTAKNFSSGLPVKWCPGCGDFAILSMLQKTMANMGLPLEQYAVISGIGCSSRFPYYVSTYGFHSIHGRALPIATGVKLSKPELAVWVITGDGDGMSIGGNHLIHAIRRNISLKIVLFNNRIYGLTKGQASPTTLQGSKTKTTPLGAIDYPFDPTRFAIGLDCTFVARGIDNDIAGTSAIFERAARHTGTAFVEVLQKCVPFTDKEFDSLKDPATKEEMLLRVEHGKPLVFGKDKNKGISFRNMRAEIVEFKAGAVPAEVAIYDETNADMAYLVSGLPHPEFPTPIGVLKAVRKPAYEEMYYDQVKTIGNTKEHELEALLSGPDAWEIK